MDHEDGAEHYGNDGQGTETGHPVLQESAQEDQEPAACLGQRNQESHGNG